MNNNFNYDDRNSYGSHDPIFLTDEALGIPSYDREDVKRTSSKVFLSLFVYLLLVNVIMFAISIVLGILIGTTENEGLYELVSGYAFSVIASSAVQYVIAFPIFYIMLRSISKPGVYTKERLSVKEYLLFLLIGEGLMLAGSIAGSFISEFIGGLFGFNTENSLDAVIGETPLWIIILSVCVLAPIFEELIYRKLIMDRFGRLGGTLAVILSALAFALMHCNLYQFFYALAVGALFGYVYEKTHNVIYTISMHMILNFIGSVATLPIVKASDELIKMLMILEEGGVVDETAYMINQLIVSAYTFIQLGLMAGGIIALVLYVRNHRSDIRLTLDKPAKGIIGTALSGAGAITFIIFCLILTALNLFTGV